MEFNKKDIANRLREWAKKNGFEKIKDLAKFLDTTETTLKSAYLNGRSIPGPKILAILSKNGCDIHWLLTGKETGGAPEEIFTNSLNLGRKMKRLERLTKLSRKELLEEIKEKTELLNEITAELLSRDKNHNSV